MNTHYNRGTDKLTVELKVLVMIDAKLSNSLVVDIQQVTDLMCVVSSRLDEGIKIGRISKDGKVMDIRLELLMV